jgi:DNA-binding NarL/FixJ family response regulator
MHLLYVEDHAIVLEALSHLMTHWFPGVVVSRACTLHEALDYLEAGARQRGVEIDLVLLDLALPDAEGLDSLRRLREHAVELGLDIPVIVLTATDCSELERQSLEAGASAYIRKSAASDDLRRALTAVLAGVLPGAVVSFPPVLRPMKVLLDPPYSLTEKQLEVVELAVLGLTNKQIALRLDIAEISVRKRLTRPLAKLRAANRTQLQARLIENGIRLWVCPVPP